jgi:outer membrane protein TolC
MIERYRAGEVALLDVLNAVDREQDTAQNFLNAFLGFRRSVLELQEMTYWDFEMDLPLLDRYAIETDDLN